MATGSTLFICTRICAMLSDSDTTSTFSAPSRGSTSVKRTFTHLNRSVGSRCFSTMYRLFCEKSSEARTTRVRSSTLRFFLFFMVMLRLTSSPSDHVLSW